MSLYADALAAASNSAVAGMECGLASLVREHPQGDDIGRIVRDHRIRASIADRKLNEAGINLAASVIRRHRAGECKHCKAAGRDWSHEVTA